METISSVLNLISPRCSNDSIFPGCSMSSIDIKDAYNSVPIEEESQNFQISIQGAII